MSSLMQKRQQIGRSLRCFSAFFRYGAAGIFFDQPSYITPATPKVVVVWYNLDEGTTHGLLRPSLSHETDLLFRPSSD